MRTRTKKFPLSKKGIDDAISYLESYKKQLISKTQRLLEELAKIGIAESDERFEAASNGTTDTSHTSTIESVHFDGNNVTMTIRISGKDLVFIEYGAGVHYNGHAGENVHESDKFVLAHPEYRIGKYGTSAEWQWSLGVNDSWYYQGERVYGTKATMPVYGAVVAMTEDIQKIHSAAQKAFSDWS